MVIEEGISIITIVLNGENYIEETIKSVIDQEFEKLDYIIIDGGSTDSTMEIIQNYSNAISCVTSGPDGGIYHAINKGIARCRYSLVGAIHSGDKYSKGTFQKVFDSYKKTDADIVYGDILVREEFDNSFIIKRMKADHTLLDSKMSIFHPATFIKLSVYRGFGTYNCRYYSAADYELLLRLFASNFKFTYVPEVLAEFRSGGISSSNFMLSFKENCQIRVDQQSLFRAMSYVLKIFPVALFYRLRRKVIISVLGQKLYFQLKRRKAKSFSWD